MTRYRRYRAEHSLQRTAPRVTTRAPRRPAAQELRRPPQSLSVGSLGRFASCTRARSL